MITKDQRSDRLFVEGSHNTKLPQHATAVSRRCSISMHFIKPQIKLLFVGVNLELAVLQLNGPKII